MKSGTKSNDVLTKKVEQFIQNCNKQLLESNLADNGPTLVSFNNDIFDTVVLFLYWHIIFLSKK